MLFKVILQISEFAQDSKKICALNALKRFGQNCKVQYSANLKPFFLDTFKAIFPKLIRI